MQKNRGGQATSTRNTCQFSVEPLLAPKREHSGRDTQPLLWTAKRRIERNPCTQGGRLRRLAKRTDSPGRKHAKVGQTLESRGSMHSRTDEGDQRTSISGQLLAPRPTRPRAAERHIQACATLKRGLKKQTGGGTQTALHGGQQKVCPPLQNIAPYNSRGRQLIVTQTAGVEGRRRLSMLAPSATPGR